MADGIVGNAFSRQFRTGVGDQTLTVDEEATRKPDSTAFTPVLTNDPDGSDTWQITFTPDQAGVWVAEATDAAGNRYRGEYEILAVSSVTFPRVTSGQIQQPGHINRLAQRIEELPF